jgi:hypothetical protein
MPESDLHHISPGAFMGYSYELKAEINKAAEQAGIDLERLNTASVEELKRWHEAACDLARHVLVAAPKWRHRSARPHAMTAAQYLIKRVMTTKSRRSPTR